MAISQYELLHGQLPGYINDLGGDEQRTRASWVVTTFPYLEQTQLWDKWSAGQAEFAPIDILVCPSDPPADLKKPNLSYVANTGYIGNAEGSENMANGLFFDNTRTAEGAAGPADERDAAQIPRVEMTFKFLQSKGDGTNNTLMLSENNNALFWGYVSPKDRAQTKDRNYHFGFCWEQPTVIAQANRDDSIERYRKINGNREIREIDSFAQMTPQDGFPSSYHPGGVNVAFASNRVSFTSDQIDPLVYAQLMTSNHRKSDLVDAAGKPDKELPQPE